MTSIANKKPLVSVCIITYNHAAFISQAIEGALMQEIDSPIEIVIGEDFSTDHTRNICLEYQAKNPDVIKVLDHSSNLGMQRNFMSTLQACRGKYIAICEGDDYWTDSLKLRKQIEFLEHNTEFAICHHRLEMIRENGSRRRYFSPKAPKVSTFEDLAARQQIATASCVFRNNLFEFPDFFVNVHGTDYALNLLNAYHGKIRFFDTVMGVYRIHDQGEWSGRNTIDRIEKAVDTIRKCREYFYPRAADEFDFHAEKAECFLLFEKKEFKEYRAHVSRLLKDHSRFMALGDFPGLLKRYFLSIFPFFIGIYANRMSRIKNAAKIF